VLDLTSSWKGACTYLQGILNSPPHSHQHSMHHVLQLLGQVAHSYVKTYFFFFANTGGWIQGLMLDRQELLSFELPSSPFCFQLFFC
jgi:hypothetical protein